MNTPAEKYYAGIFPEKLFVHGEDVSTNPDPEELGAVIATVHTPEQQAFLKELCRRWNGFPILESTCLEVRETAQKRKTVIRMQNGMMLDTFVTIRLKETN